MTGSSVARTGEGALNRDAGRTSKVVRPIVDGLADVRWELFEGASHWTHLEQTERFNALVASFLAEHD